MQRIIMRLAGFVKIKGDGSELFVRAHNKTLDIEELRKILGQEFNFKHESPNAYCLLQFQTQAEAAQALDSLKSTARFLVRYAYKHNQQS